jgi:hypothetical protein
VYGTASSFLGPALYDDTAIVVLKFPSGALCVIDNSRQTTYGYDVRMEALGPKGMATLTNPPVSSVIFSAQHGHTVDVVCTIHCLIISSFPHYFLIALSFPHFLMRVHYFPPSNRLICFFVFFLLF